MRCRFRFALMTLIWIVSADMSDDTAKLVHIELLESARANWSAEIEHERNVAIYDILEDNSFTLLKSAHAAYPGPYHLALGLLDGRLVFDVATPAGDALMSFRLALGPFRKIIKDYFAICDSYYEAIRGSAPQRIEAIDMGRRGLHNEGSQILRDRLADKIDIDMPTARRMFTLICALHMSQTRGHR